MTFIVSTFYHFFDFADYGAWQMPLRDTMVHQHIVGTVLLTPEGINGTVCGARAAVDAFIDLLRRDVARFDFSTREHAANAPVFRRAKVKLKPETISLGEPANASRAGTHLSPQAWNALCKNPDVIVIDARNAYEIELGRFKNARDPGTRTFKELPAYVQDNLGDAKHKAIATYCTGGIRCEKFTAWLLAQGYTQVYHLKGGILNYLDSITPEESLWQGTCFVFDERVSVGSQSA